MRNRVKPKTLREARGEFLRGGAARLNAVHRYKNANSPQHVFSRFESLFPSTKTLEQVYGKPFPATLGEMLSTTLLPGPSSNLTEVVWAIRRCALYADELNKFVGLRRTVDECFLTGDKEGVASALENVENNLGTSFWLVQNKLLQKNQFGDPDDARRLGNLLAEQLPSSSLQAHMVTWFVKRIETRGQHVDLNEEIASAFGKNEGMAGLAYAQTKVTGHGKTDQLKIAPSLYVESHTSIVDLYDLLVTHLTTICTLRSMPRDVVDLLRRAVTFLASRIRDCRLNNIGAVIGASIDFDDLVDAENDALESYAAGDYRRASALSKDLLTRRPADMLAMCILVRSAIRIGASADDFADLSCANHRHVAKHLHSVFSLSAEAYASANAVFVTANLYYTQDWAIFLRVVVVDVLDEEGESLLSAGQFRMHIVGQHINPLMRIIATGAARESLHNTDKLRNAFPVLSEIVDLLLTGASISNSLSGDRAARFTSRYKLSQRLYSEAAELLATVKSTHIRDRARIESLMSLAHLGNGDYTEAVRHCVNAFLLSEDAPSILPATPLRKALDEASRWPSTIDVPIVFGICSMTGTAPVEAHLRFAFETFQKRNSILHPSDILSLRGTVGDERIIAYLRYVWVPDGMRQTRLYKSEASIEDARIEVCRLLATLDEVRAPEYTAEIREGVKRQEISKGLKLVEESKVYVDVPAIKKRLRKSLGAQYANYRSLNALDQSGPNTVLDILGPALTDMSVATKRSIGDLLSEIHVLGDVDSSEAYTQFDALYSEVTKEFLRGDSGLNAYLSTRVRHGRLKNELRKAVAEDHLVTNEIHGKGGYAPNTYWTERTSDLSPEQRTELERALLKFTSDFDATTAYARDEIIQVNVVSGALTPDRNGKEKALLTYRTSSLERKHLHDQMRQIDDIGDFIEVCIDTLWSKTDQNLIRVRAAIEGEITRRFRKTFDGLYEAIEEMPQVASISDLRNKIVRCDTATQNKLSEISDWFTRSTVYDREDYAPRLAVDIASTMVRKTLPDFAGAPTIITNTNESSGKMPGHSLDAMVDAFYGLITNAVEHSAVASDDLLINIDLVLDEANFVATVTNTIGDEKPTPFDLDRVAKIEASLGRSDSPTRAQVEGGSGTHKLWRAVNSPFYSYPVLSFGFTGERTFSLTFGFRIAEDADESTIG
ncbi:hypothetical protein [Luteibacter sp. 3190]|uniref:hypothetical protein n=1 Tax=Luteibacter sp. 3190 TaxID=2817736 RepID=UPI0028675484|nr:hypothetical protein [Luteibacter sp. 3190]MDR6937332.1 hypothetical protein [Luteibacter sp. 3190]